MVDLFGAVAAVPVIAMFVSGFAPFNGGEAFTIIPESTIKRIRKAVRWAAVAVVLQETSKPAGIVLSLSGLIAVAYLGLQTVKLDVIARQRMYVVLILTFFSLFFWAFFEQAGSSLNNFADRNVNRVIGQTRTIEGGNVGTTIQIQPTQEQLGFSNGDRVFTMDQLAELREANKDNPEFTVEWTVSADNVGMVVADRDDEIPASWFQSINAVYILVFGLVFTALWGFLGKRRIEPGTPYKFAWGCCNSAWGSVRSGIAPKPPTSAAWWRWCGCSLDIYCRQRASFAFRRSACR